MADHASPERPHDGRFAEQFDGEIDLRGVFWVAVGILVTAVLGMLITWWAWRAFVAPKTEVADVPAIALPAPPRLPTQGPLLQSHPEAELDALREEMAHELASWELHGDTAKVPIDVAIEVLLARGVASRPAPEPVESTVAPPPATPAPAEPAPASHGHGG